MGKINSNEEVSIKKKKWSAFAKFNLVALIIVVLAAVAIIAMDPANLSSGDYGAGDYYYTDLEGFEKIFYTMNLGTNKPVLFFSLFFGWGLICWIVLKYLDRKL